MRTLVRSACSFSLAVVGYEVTGHLMHVQQLGLLLYPIILAIAFVIFLRANVRFSEPLPRLPSTCRGLRPVLLASRRLTHPVEEFYHRRQRELNWVRTALRILWSLQGGELPGCN